MDEFSSPDNERSAKPRRTRQNPFFGMALFSAAIFVLTILAMVAAIFGDPRAPVAKFLEAHGGRLIAAEVVATLILGFLALALDRFQSRRAKPRKG